MIDEDWLASLNFTSADGLHFHGLVGVGSNNVVLRATAPDGEELAVKARRHHLGFHIKEIPLFLSGSAKYDVNRVNRKLLKLVGDNRLDEMTVEYDRLFSAQLKALHGASQQADPSQVAALVPIIGMSMTPTCPEAWPFLFCTPMFERRLEEIATLPPENPQEPLSMFASVNGENFRIGGFPSHLAKWARGLLKGRQHLLRDAPFAPATLSQNPLFVWGAAVMDGFFTDAELPEVVRFIETNFGRLPTHANVDVLLAQIDAIATALTCLKDSEISRLVKLCGMLGFMFDVHDQTGKVVASSMKLGR